MPTPFPTGLSWGRNVAFTARRNLVGTDGDPSPRVLQEAGARRGGDVHAGGLPLRGTVGAGGPRLLRGGGAGRGDRARDHGRRQLRAPSGHGRARRRELSTPERCSS